MSGSLGTASLNSLRMSCRESPVGFSATSGIEEVASAVTVGGADSVESARDVDQAVASIGGLCRPGLLHCCRSLEGAPGCWWLRDPPRLPRRDNWWSN